MKTLILNADYKPLSIISPKRAVVLDVFNPNVMALSYYDDAICSERHNYNIPAVMVSQKYITGIKSKTPTKKNIRARDKSLCGYCGTHLSSNNFTIDHIIPASRYPSKTLANTWENQVSCCKSCNTKKRNRTPEEAGMKLLIKPRKLYGMIINDIVPEQWKEYL